MTTSTETLIDTLADGMVPVPKKQLERWLVLALAVGALVALMLIGAVLGLRPDLSLAMSDSRFWTKLIYTAGLAGISLAGARHLARPETTRIRLGYFVAPVAVLAALAIAELTNATSAQRQLLVFGHTWRQCPLLIATISLPLLAILLRLFARFAPERPRLTGAIVGLTAGATSATLYSLHCPEMAMTFVLLWYSAGIAITALLGALAAPRILRW